MNSRILKICKLYCLLKDACAVAAVFLIANFLTRSDVKKLYLEEMIMWCLKVTFLFKGGYEYIQGYSTYNI